jgi:hypothetical protein
MGMGTSFHGLAHRGYTQPPRWGYTEACRHGFCFAARL